MNCSRCGHRLWPEVAERRHDHARCPIVCDDAWCSHPSHPDRAVRVPQPQAAEATAAAA